MPHSVIINVKVVFFFGLTHVKPVLMRHSKNLVATYLKILSIKTAYEFFSKKVSIWPIHVIIEDLP